MALRATDGDENLVGRTPGCRVRQPLARETVEESESASTAPLRLRLCNCTE